VVRVTDGESTTADQELSLVIAPAPLSLLLQELNEGKVGLQYEHTFAARGGVSPYTWTNTSPLPAGLSLDPDGLLTGFPEVEGTYTLALQVEDSLGSRAGRDYNLAIALVDLMLLAGNQTIGEIEAEGFKLTFSTDTAGRYGFDVSQDLVSWATLYEFEIVSGPTNLIDATAGEVPWRYYRVVLLR
jgi:hypothetical protein